MRKPFGQRGVLCRVVIQGTNLYVMAHSKVKEDVLNQPELLQQVVDFKKKFYPQNRARYDLAVPKTLKLLPPEHSVSLLKEDYAAMKKMIYGRKLQ